MPEDKTIHIYLKPKDPDEKYVSAEVLAKYLQNVQSLLYHVADELEGNKSRKGGDFPGRMKQEYKLVIKDMKMGSADVQLGIFDGQTTLPTTEQTIGAMAIKKMNAIIDTVPVDHNLDEQLETIITDDRRRERVIGLLDDIWPDPESTYVAKIGFNGSRDRVLNPEYKKYLVKEMEKSEESREATYVGRLTKISVDKDRDLQINTTEGIINCTYNNLIDSFIREESLIGSLIRARGVLTIDRKGIKTLHIENAKDIKKMEGIPLTFFKLKNEMTPLKRPIVLSVEYVDDEYIVYNDELSIHAASDNMKDAIEDIYNSIDILWTEYVEADPDTLTEDAIQFRNLLKGLVEG